MSYKHTFIYGLAIWAIAFIAGILAFPLRENQRALFESIMPVVITFVTCWMSVRQFRESTGSPLRVGLQSGIIWLLTSLVIDQFFFNWGPMKMSVADYIKDIGLTYLLIPMIPIAMGLTLKKRSVSEPVQLPPQ